MDPVYLKVIGVTLLLTTPITPIQPTCLLEGHIPTKNPTDLQNLGLQKKMNIHVQLTFITKVIITNLLLIILGIKITSYTVQQIITHNYCFAGNQGNHQNFDP